MTTIYLPPDSPLAPFGEACGHEFTSCSPLCKGPDGWHSHCAEDRNCTGIILTTKRQEALVEELVELRQHTHPGYKQILELEAYQSLGTPGPLAEVVKAAEDAKDVLADTGFMENDGEAVAEAYNILATALLSKKSQP